MPRFASLRRAPLGILCAALATACAAPRPIPPATVSPAAVSPAAAARPVEPAAPAPTEAAATPVAPAPPLAPEAAPPAPEAAPPASPVAATAPARLPLAHGTAAGYSVVPKLLWTRGVPGAGTSSPRLVELNGDGVADVVIGAGKEDRDGLIVALDGRTGKGIWRRELQAEVYGTAVLLDVNGDGKPEVFDGGRFNDFQALDGATGKVRWRLSRANPGVRLGHNYFNTATALPDQDGDGLADLVVLQGGYGDDSERIPGRLRIVSTASGKILHDVEVSDRKEAYSVPVLIPDAPTPTAIVGTGGETLPGNLLRLDLRTGAESLRVPAGKLGVLSSPVLHQFTPGIWEVVVAAFDGTVLRLRADDGTVLWRSEHKGFQIHSSVALGFFNDDDVLDVVTLVEQGRFPDYRKLAKVIWLDGATGATLFEAPLGVSSQSSPVVVDLDGDGYDEVIVASSKRFAQEPANDTALLAAYDGRTKSRLFLLQFPGRTSATPDLSDVDGDGTLDLVFASWGHVVRVALPLTTPAKPQVRWRGYRGAAFDNVVPREVREDAAAAPTPLGAGAR